MPETKSNIHLHIERLILDGLPIDRAQAPAVQAAVEAELGRLLTEQGLSTDWQAGGAVPGIRANAIQLSDNNTAAQLGQQIARSVYGGIGPINSVSHGGDKHGSHT